MSDITAEMTATTSSDAADIVEALRSNPNARIVVHFGQSQYSENGGASSCGLAAFNAARVILGMERDGMRDDNLVSRVLEMETMEEILSLCPSWPASHHLDAETIHQTPIFRQSLVQVEESLNMASDLQHFYRLLSDLQLQVAKHRSSCCAIVTRPPEIVACFCISLPPGMVFIIFDSHPRPDLHPEGAAFLCFSSATKAGQYLADLFSYDRSLLTEDDLQWQAQLLGTFSRDIFVSKPLPRSNEEWVAETLGSSLEMLSLQAEHLEMKARLQELTNENRRLRTALQDQQAAMTAMAAFAQQATPGTSGPAVGTEAHEVLAISEVSEVVNVDDPVPEVVPLDEENIPLAHWERLLEDERATQDDQGIAHGTEVSAHTFDCGICMETRVEDFVSEVNWCGHRYCRECISKYISAELAVPRYPILCPLCKADQDRPAPTELDRDFVEQVGISEEQYIRFLEMEMFPFAIPIRCVHCDAEFRVDKMDYDETKVIVCPLLTCRRSWCKDCNRKVDEDGLEHSCDGSSELRHLMDQRRWKYCPGCRIPTEKIDGCNHMACASPGCNTHFCYVCGQRIVASVVAQEIAQALTAHYATCNMFEDVLDF